MTQKTTQKAVMLTFSHRVETQIIDQNHIRLFVSRLFQLIRLFAQIIPAYQIIGQIIGSAYQIIDILELDYQIMHCSAYQIISTQIIFNRLFDEII